MSSLRVKEPSAVDEVVALLIRLHSNNSPRDSASSRSSKADRTIEVVVMHTGGRRLGSHTPRRAARMMARKVSCRRKRGGAAVQRVAPGRVNRGNRAPCVRSRCSLGIAGMGNHKQERKDVPEQGSSVTVGLRDARSAGVDASSRAVGSSKINPNIAPICGAAGAPCACITCRVAASGLPAVRENVISIGRASTTARGSVWVAGCSPPTTMQCPAPPRDPVATTP